MKLRCYLRDIRGKRSMREVAREAGISSGLVSLLERGRYIPKDGDLPALERAYGEPWERWYHPFALKALEADEETA